MFRGMRVWFQNVVSYLGFDDAPDALVVGILHTAALRSASIGIGTLDGAALPSPLSGHIEDLEADALVISRPHEGPTRRELVTGESLYLSIASDNGFPSRVTFPETSAIGNRRLQPVITTVSTRIAAATRAPQSRRGMKANMFMIQLWQPPAACPPVVFFWPRRPRLTAR